MLCEMCNPISCNTNMTYACSISIVLSIILSVQVSIIVILRIINREKVGCVTIGQYISVCMDHSGGDRCIVCMVYSRWIEVGMRVMARRQM